MNNVVKEEKEEIVEVLRAHPCVLFSPTFKIILGFVIVIVVFFVAGASWIFSLFFFLWLIAGGTYFFYYWYAWKKDAYIISEGGITVREQTGIFTKHVSKADFGDITDATYTVSGFAASLFNFGNVEIQTASSDPLILKKVAKPHKVQKLILELKSEQEK